VQYRNVNITGLKYFVLRFYSGSRGELHNLDLHDFYPRQLFIILRRMSRVGHVARMGQKSNGLEVFFFFGGGGF